MTVLPGFSPVESVIFSSPGAWCHVEDVSGGIATYNTALLPRSHRHLLTAFDVKVKW